MLCFQVRSPLGPFASFLSVPRARYGAWLLCRVALYVALAGLCAQRATGEDLSKVIDPLVQAYSGNVAVAVKHLGTGESYYHHADVPMPTASLIKFPIMVSAYGLIDRGRLSLDQRLTLTDKDKVPGSGILSDHFSQGTTLSLRDAIHLMIAFSDNTATNLVIDQVGLETVRRDMKELECPETLLNSKVFRRDTTVDPDRSQKYGLGSTTAREMVRLLERLQQGTLVSKSASQEMLRHLESCLDRTKLGRRLPDRVKFAHKTGEVSASRTDAGIIEAPSGPIAICVLTDQNEDPSEGDDNPANVLCAEIGQAVYRYFQPDDEAPATDGTLALGAFGPLVESLQRTLNARLQPSPGLSVDGDFGPMTQTAVLRFQREQGLPESGEVQPEMWKALGNLVTEDEPVADPSVVNAEVHSRTSPDPVMGAPFVTAKAWAIADGQTGRLLAGMHEDEPRAIASTTKIMTALLVARWAEAHPEALAETVTFSQRADATEGSTSGVREGESISVGELLYGLLLPSGNDASVALAEHFGQRLAPPTSQTASRLEQFVEAMNAAAAELGMTHTHFANPHGLPNDEHLSTARDLATLTFRAMANPIIRNCVGTHHRGCTVTGPGGYTRNIRWTNTNRLLDFEGFDGVKTGTTDAAGACLVGSGVRNGTSRIVVVLGSTSSDARYTDIRNLFRYAWMLDGRENPSTIQP